MSSDFDFNALPRLSARRVAVHIQPQAEKALRHGHPWLYADAITQQSHQGQAGDLAVVYDRKKRFLALGLYDPASPIRVKLLQHGQPATIDEAWFARAVQAAWTRRSPLLDSATDGYRLIHGENDGLPALIVDRYAETLVLKLYSAAWLPHLAQVVAALRQLRPWERGVLRLSRRMQGQHGLVDGLALWGDSPPGPIIFRENGLRFQADVVRGHKTGFFFDQRDNRARVGQLAEGRHMLDVFAYAGGFSVYAAVGGALSALAVDVSAAALQAAQAHWALNAQAIGAAQLEVRVGSALEVMESLRRRRFGLVVVDPPSLAKRTAEVPGALAHYQALAQAALPLCGDGAVLVLASCSSHVSPADFEAAATRALKRCGRRWQVIERTAHALDHPIGFPEGAYLKALFIRLD
ncbi:MAG: class I SAM-dependent methyltransferase [Anaerolineae bacterium]|nr:class I SAM-dependent methyltransferase [Anaerolineae bacterium]